jgi:hypothetical protein
VLHHLLHNNQKFRLNFRCWDVPSSQPKVHVTIETWEPDTGPVVIGDEVQEKVQYDSYYKIMLVVLPST